MQIKNNNSSIDAASEYFEHIILSPVDWPTVVSAAIAGGAALTQWPAFPVAATLEHKRLGHGRGLSIEEARRSATGELVEIASCCDWGDLDLEWQTPASVGQEGWDSLALNGFSDAQYDNRDEWNAKFEGLDWIPYRPDPDEKIGWLKAKHATSGRSVLVPADSVIIGRRERNDLAAVAVADTNGCAAGSTPDAARLSALYELIERNATGSWWYGERKCPALETREWPLLETIETHLKKRRRQLQVLDITSDIPIPSVAALASDPDGSFLSMGFGTSLNKQDAVQSAMTELMQIELKISIDRHHRKDMTTNLKIWLDEVRMEDVPLGSERSYWRFGSERPDWLTGTVAKKLETCVDLVDKEGCQIAFVDFTRAEFGVPVFRAISPDLFHWKPHFKHWQTASVGSVRKLLRI